MTMMMMTNMALSFGNGVKVMKFGNENDCFINDGQYLWGNAKEGFGKVMRGLGNDVVWWVCWSLIVRFANGWKMV